MNTDSFPTPSIEYEYVWIKKAVFFAVLGLDGLAFIFCILCAIGIVVYRRHLTFVNTGFTLTYIFIFGCLMILMSVPLFGIDSNLTDKISIPKACMARIWLLSAGFSLSVGMMIVRVLCTAFMELVREFKSYQISPLVTLMFTSGMAIIDTIIVLTWRCRSRPYKDYITKEVELIGLQDERRTLVETCSSEKESMLIAFLCFYKGGLLLLALIISIFKREEEQKRSPDYNKCQMGLLSVLVTGSIALPTVLALRYNPNARFLIGGLVVILEVCFLMIWIKACKIFNAHKCKRGEALEFGKYSVEKGPRCIPCLRPVYGCIYDIKSQGLYTFEDLGPACKKEDDDPKPIKETNEDHDLEDSGIGFDCKESEDILPDDLPSYEDYNLKPYDPDAEQEEEEEETDDELDDKPEGETSDDSSSCSSDDEKPVENSSCSTALARSSVSVHLSKTPSENQTSFNEDDQKSSIQMEQINRSNVPSTPSTPSTAPISSAGSTFEVSESGKTRRWWKPLFGGKKKAKTTPENTVPTPSEKDESEKSEESEESEIDESQKRCATPHGGTASEYSASSNESESESD